MASIRSIAVARDFSRFPAGRFRSDGPWPGEAFREDCLVPALRSGDKVEVDLDGAYGYGSSFLEEAFGGLVRVSGFSRSELRDRLCLRSLDGSLEHEIWAYIDKAKPTKRASA